MGLRPKPPRPLRGDPECPTPRSRGAPCAPWPLRGLRLKPHLRTLVKITVPSSSSSLVYCSRAAKRGPGSHRGREVRRRLADAGRAESPGVGGDRVEGHRLWGCCPGVVGDRPGTEDHSEGSAGTRAWRAARRTRAPPRRGAPEPAEATGLAGCSAPGFLDSGLKVITSTLPRPARRNRVALGLDSDSRTSPASTARCTSVETRARRGGVPRSFRSSAPTRDSPLTCG